MKHKKETKNDEVDFLVEAKKFAEAWPKIMSKRNYFTANQLCFLFIEKYKINLNNYRDKQDDNANKLFIILIFFKGLQECSELAKLTKYRLWHKDNKLVEKIWRIKCNCKERLEFVSADIQGVIIEGRLKMLHELENFFVENFGKGMYLSPGLIADKYICSICKKDTRSCCHISGRIYKGQICYSQPVNERIDHVALVREPKDPRCRIWPWNIKENKDGEGVILDNSILLTSCSVDDFLRE
ncbi:MAG: hypothetical protein WBM32_10545 [Crocosphaera sp.]